MTRFLTVILCTAASAMAAKAAFKKPCPVDLDICGWDLQAGYGYDQETLSEATTYAGQDAGVGTFVYDSIYNCYPEGEIGWSAWCGGAGQCEPPVNKLSHALCKGEPVDTGASPPPDSGSDEGGSDGGGSDDGGIVYDPPIDGSR